jgi:exopolyphosphatase/guanosine-5'-triphosphate,3'-diphosphate pyrophosphatase
VRDLPGGAVEQLEQGQIGTRLGEGLRAAGSLAPGAMDRTLAATVEFAGRARAHGASLSSIATSAMRRARNAAAFAARLRDMTGLELHVLDGNAEAHASFVGATHDAARDGKRTAVIDVGGGSTEVAVGCDGRLERALSFEIGSVRVSERFRDLTGDAPGAAARAAANDARANIDREIVAVRELRPIERARAVAGTPLTIAAIRAESHVDRVSDTVLTLEALETTIGRLLDLPLQERRDLPGMLPQRADILAGGALVLAQTMRHLGVDEVLVEANDLLLGYLILTRAPLE